MRVLVTGGAGFIGSNFIRILVSAHPDYEVVNLDKLTYAGNLDNLRDIEKEPRYRFIHGDIANADDVSQAMDGVNAVVNFAAETHVDRSIFSAGGFIQTDVMGMYVLLEEARARGIKRFVCVSTDEVYGSIADGSSTERDILMPGNPYSASKAGGELLALSYYNTYGAPVTITRGSNNYGPYQYPEKLIPLFITNAIDDKPLPLYGDGLNVRNWLYVEDHCRGIDFVLQHGEPGQVYNIGGSSETTNIEVTRTILRLLGKGDNLIKPVKDRPGHDRRYSLDSAKLRSMGWKPRVDFDTGMELTVNWYRDNEWWWRKLKSGEYLEYYKRQYVERDAR